jgi:peroxiredoxin
MGTFWRFLFLVAAVPAMWCQTSSAPPLDARENSIEDRIGRLRSLPDDEWTVATGQLARQIRQLPMGAGKQWLIGSFSSRVTEGDAGPETLQLVADTIGDVVRNLPPDRRAPLCDTLARLVRYEHVRSSLDDPSYRAALAKLAAADRSRETAEFTLSDLKDRRWALKDLRGKVVLVNFWATWCPPCRKELPDLQVLSERFSARGLVILAVSDEDAKTVESYLAACPFTYPILLDPGRTVHTRFGIEGIPETFVYDRGGRLVAEAMDRRTLGQFLKMLKQAGLE